MSNLTTSGTGVDTFASIAAVNKFLALEAQQRVGYVDRDRNTDKADLQIFWSRCQIKCDNESIGTMSASRVTSVTEWHNHVRFQRIGRISKDVVGLQVAVLQLSADGTETENPCIMHRTWPSQSDIQKKTSCVTNGLQHY